MGLSWGFALGVRPGSGDTILNSWFYVCGFGIDYRDQRADTYRDHSHRDFVRAGQAVALHPDGRKAFFRAYEQRMDTLVTHPLFGYRLNYRRMLEIQTRLLARVVTGEVPEYPVFVTR